MNGLAGRLASIYAAWMKLYPRRYQNEFSAERCEVFETALRAAGARGDRALLGLFLRELRDLPASVARANWREWEVTMQTIHNQLEEGRLSWLGLLAGLLPFILLGPVMAVAPYLPGSLAGFFSLDSAPLIAIVLLTSVLCVIVGWRQGYPRWVYPYLVILFFAVAEVLLTRLSLLLGPNRMPVWLTIAIFLAVIVVISAAILFVLNRFPPTRKIVQDINLDWTRLSFGMVTYPAFATGFYGGDHLPPFGLRVILPSTLVTVGALAYLLCRSQSQRILALLGTLALGFSTVLLFPSDDPPSILVLFLLIGWLFLPALLVRLSPARRRPAAEN